MLSYQHIFHAGNHADILKHCVLIQVLNSLNKKEKPYTFYDTHAASGLYDLTDGRSLKTGEAERGIIQLLREADNKKTDSNNPTPKLLQGYFDFVESYLKESRYPGSPEIERAFMRPQDFLLLSELHPQEIENLRANMKRPCNSAPSIQIHNRSGWEMLKALTPPSTKRGAVLIDPSYEENKDYTDAVTTISAVIKKWSNGIIMLWYPLLAYRENEIKEMLENIICNSRKINPNIEISDLRFEIFGKEAHKELSLEEYRNSKEKNPPRLYGSGVLVLNSPWMLKETVEETLAYLKNVSGFQLQAEGQA